MIRLPSIHRKYALFREMKPLRIDHFNRFSTDVDDSVAYYADLGIRVTERTVEEETATPSPAMAVRSPCFCLCSPALPAGFPGMAKR